MSYTLIAPDMEISLLAVLKLVRMNIFIIFIQRKAVLTELERNVTVIGKTNKDHNGLF